MLVEEFAGDDADDAFVEVGVFDEEDGVGREGFTGDRFESVILEGATGFVEVVEGSSEREGRAGIGGEEEIKGDVGVVDATGGVEARAELEGDGAGGDVFGVDFCELHEGFETGATGFSEDF